MTAAEAIELSTLIHPRTAIPVHYEGWSHFTQGREGIEHDVAQAPDEIRNTFHFLKMGTPTTIPSSAIYRSGAT